VPQLANHLLSAIEGDDFRDMWDKESTARPTAAFFWPIPPTGANVGSCARERVDLVWDGTGKAPYVGAA